MKAYGELEQRFGRIAALQEASGVLYVDMATLMPSGGAEARSEQLAALAVTSHELLTAPDVGQWLAEAEDSAAELEIWQRANLDEMRRAQRHATALDPVLVEAQSKASSACEKLWRQARPANDFKSVLPSLSEVWRLAREAAASKAAAFGCSKYEALLDSFEPGGSEAKIDALFADLAAYLPETLGQVLERQRQAGPILPLPGPFPRALQESLGRRIMTLMGFDFAHGRLDQSLHPFCGGVPEDVRITTRYRDDSFTQALMGVMHETGHALYERGLPAAWRRQPVGVARGMALHESQSLLMEMQAGRSPAFLSFLAPLARAAFGGAGSAWDVENFRRHYHRVQPSFIRVDADELTYPAHVILRYRLEKALLADDLPLADLPGAWNAGMQELLGVVPPSDTLGCLQDIHWFDGLIGYFPTYTMGALAAAQLMAAAQQAVPMIPTALASGDFRPLLTWLREKVHSQASLFSSDEILVRATGRPLDVTDFKAHIKTRYLS